MNEQQTQRMQEIKARHTATTQGEWKATKSECACESYECDKGVSRYEASERACSGCDGFAITEGASVIGPREVDCGEYSYYTDEDAEFMASAHQDIPWLIEQLESLQREQAERESPRPAALNTHVGLRTEYETPHSCGNCGEHISADWPFCPECGTPTGIAATVAEPKPLTPEEFSALASRDPVWGTHVFVKSLITGKIYNALADVSHYGVIAILGANGIFYLCNYGVEWIAYATEPKGEAAK